MDFADKELQRMKIDAHAPCVYYEWTGQSRLRRAPSINCSPGENCKKCGFNPAEHRRRLRDGQMKPISKRKGWIEDQRLPNKGYVTTMDCPPGTKHLVFQAADKGEVSE